MTRLGCRESSGSLRARFVLRSTTAESGDVIRYATAEGGRSLALPGVPLKWAIVERIRPPMLVHQ